MERLPRASACRNSASPRLKSTRILPWGSRSIGRWCGLASADAVQSWEMFALTSAAGNFKLRLGSARTCLLLPNRRPDEFGCRGLEIPGMLLGAGSWHPWGAFGIRGWPEIENTGRAPAGSSWVESSLGASHNRAVRPELQISRV